MPENPPPPPRRPPPPSPTQSTGPAPPPRPDGKPAASLTPETIAFLERNTQRAQRSPGERWIDRMLVMKGIFTVFSALLIAVIGPIAISLAGSTARDTGATLPAFAVPFVNHPWLLALIALPAIAGGVMLIVTRRYRWVALTVSTLLLVLILGIVLGIFIPMLSSIYSSAMQPL